LDHYVEASIDLERKEVEFPFDQLDKDKRLIYCSFGSQTHRYPRLKGFLQTAIDTMWEKRDSQMILSTGSKVDTADFRSVPPNVFVVETAPQLQVLRRASLMITHGGLNSVKECIFYGVPMIVFPVDRDQPLNAARVVYHGLGLRGSTDALNATELLSMINRVDGDPAFKARVEKMGKRFRDMEELQESTQIIEKALEFRTGACKGSLTEPALKP
jgi:MGT family glycosyltransferase